MENSPYKIIIQENQSSDDDKYIKINSKLLQLIHLFKENYPDLYEIRNKIILITFGIGFTSLLFKLFDLTTIIYLFLIFLSLFCLMIFKIYEIRKNGILFYLNDRLKNLMERRSIFDILMDLWYLPTISEYIMLVVKPFIYKMPPEEATLILEDFDSSTRNFFLTKGIMNLFPNRLRNLMLPTKIEIDEFFSQNKINKSNQLAKISSNNDEMMSGSTTDIPKKIEQEMKNEDLINSEKIIKSKSLQDLNKLINIKGKNFTNYNRIPIRLKQHQKNPNVSGLFQKKYSFNSNKSRLSGSNIQNEEINLKQDNHEISNRIVEKQQNLFHNRKNSSNSICLYKQKKDYKITGLKIPSPAISKNSSNISLFNFNLEEVIGKVNFAKTNEKIHLRQDKNLLIAEEITENINNVLAESIHLNKNLIIPRSNSYSANLYFNPGKGCFDTLVNKIQNKNSNISPLFKDVKEDFISENSFERDIYKSKNKFENEEKTIKKLKINHNNNSSNINGYAPLVKKSEVKDNSIYNYYEYTDENNKKIVFKTRVLESSDLLKNETEKEILCFDTSSKLRDLTDFKWDNLNTYINKQERLSKKLSSTNEPEKRINFFSMLSNRIKDQILKKIDHDKMKKIFGILLASLLIQIIFSRKIRNWSVSFIQYLMFLSTSIGCGGIMYFMLKRNK